MNALKSKVTSAYIPFEPPPTSLQTGGERFEYNNLINSIKTTKQIPSTGIL